MLQKALPTMDEAMFKDATDEAVVASDFGVKSREDFHVFHYMEHYADDIAEEIIGQKLSPMQIMSLKRYMYSLKDKVDFSNLVTFRAAVLSWIKKNHTAMKMAYPNRMGPPEKMKAQNQAEWDSLAAEVHSLIRRGKSEQEALFTVASNLHPYEKFDFMAWYKFRFGIGKLYNVQNVINEESEGTMKTKKIKNALFQETESKYFLPEYKVPEPEKPQPNAADLMAEKEKQENFNTARGKLIARTFAIDKLLEKYRDVFSVEEAEALEEALYNLKRKIRVLTRAATAEDAFIKTANIFRNNNFVLGAHFLMESLEEVFGKQSKLQKTAAEIDYAELQGVLNDLYNISNYLKRRDVVRQLAQIDLKLHNMMISSFFPEISEAQSKLIDSMGYASNKLEDVMPKIRSAVHNPQQAGPPPLGTPPQEAAQRTQEFAGEAAQPSPQPTPAVPEAPAAEAPAPTEEAPAQPSKLETQLGNI